MGELRANRKLTTRELLPDYFRIADYSFTTASFTPPNARSASSADATPRRGCLGIGLRPVFKRRHARLAELRHLRRKLCSTLERQRDRNKSIAWIANKLQEIRLRVVVHYIPANAKLWSDDLNHLACQRRLFIARPAVDQGKIHRTPRSRSVCRASPSRISA